MNIFIFILYFIITTFFAVLQSAVFPNIRLIGYAPLFAVIALTTSKRTAIFCSVFAGIIIDLFASTSFGFNALLYCLSIFFLYDQKRFFKDEALSLSLYTIIICMVISSLRYLLYFIFSLHVFFSFYTIFSDIIIMSVVDGIFSMIFIFIPIKLIEKIKYLAS
jgi:rod shape-determining protein MreD